MAPRVSIGEQIRQHAAAYPNRPAFTFIAQDRSPRSFTWEDLDRRTNRIARLLSARGITPLATLAIVLPNSIEHVLLTIAAWKLGACVLPLNPGLTLRERQQLLDLSQPRLVVQETADAEAAAHLVTGELRAADEYSDRALPDRLPAPGKAMGTGGTSGTPKLIVDPRPLGSPMRGLDRLFGFRGGQRQLVTAGLFHNMAFMFAHGALYSGQHLLLLDKFEAHAVLDVIETHRIDVLGVVPTMMHRMLADLEVQRRDLTSVKSLVHAAAACPANLKRAWMDLLGPDRVYEFYGATEAIGNTVIRGDDWLKHPGSVGRPAPNTEVRILDEAAQAIKPGAVGLVHMRYRAGPTPACQYIGAPQLHTTRDGFVTVGDLGRLDADGYLYVVGRLSDMIVSGGANVYVAEVEAALMDHPRVADAAVVGVPDAEWGSRVHAVVQAKADAAKPTAAELDAHCRERLAAYKVPRSYEFVTRLPRDAAGKIRRSALLSAGSAPS